jgi:uncharacterized protein (DUF302 family)
MQINKKYETSIRTLILSVFFLFLPSSLFGENSKNLAVFYTIEGNAEAKYNKIVEEALPNIGFNLADPHHRVNDQYKTKYGSTVLDILSFLPVVNDNNVMPLFNIDPRLAGFAPFNMLIHKTLDENITHVGHLTPEAILDIIGITDEKVKKDFIASFEPLNKLLDKEFGAEKKSYKTYTKLSNDNMINFEYEFERPDDMDDFVDEFQNKFEMSFINKEYLIAGFHDFLGTDEGEDILEDFDIFWAYSLCHLGYSYNMFDTKDARPDAGLFAPCTMYMYVKKGTNKLVVGMPKLINIMDTLHVKESSRVELIKKLDKEIPEILTVFGMKAVENVNPFVETPKEKFNTAAIAVALTKTTKKVLKIEEKTKKPNKSKVVEIQLPTVPKAVQVKVNGHNNHGTADRSIKFSKRMPPNYITSAERYGKGGEGSSLSHSSVIPGEPDKGRIAAYLRASLIDVVKAKEKLKNAGFDVIAVAPLDKKKKLISIVFTNDALKKLASQENKGHLATLRLLIDPKNKQISITNPIYLAKAFLQDGFDKKVPKEILTALVKEFKSSKNSFDKLKFQLLPKYQFMNGMPFFKDHMVVARGDNLKAKLVKNKRVIYSFDLANGATIVGVKLSKRTQKFPKRIGTNNAGMLPYPLLIENGEAKILDPKYYLALMYPQLTMEEFMTIATVPDAIRKDCTKVFR